METTTYVTVFPATNNRRGWMVASRSGDNIVHTRLEFTASDDPEGARAEAIAKFPGKTVYMKGDKVKPWEKVAA